MHVPALLLDEPFAGVDPINVHEIQELVERMRSRGIGILITDHNVRETLQTTDRSYIIHAGKILREGDAEFLPQEKSFITMTRRLRKDDGRLDLSALDATALVRHVRAMTPWPGARTELLRTSGERLPFTVHAALSSERPAWAGAQAGDLCAEGERLFLALSAGCVELTRVQPAGKRPMPVSDFLRGARLEEGARLESGPCRG